MDYPQPQTSSSATMQLGGAILVVLANVLWMKELVTFSAEKGSCVWLSNSPFPFCNDQGGHMFQLVQL